MQDAVLKMAPWISHSSCMLSVSPASLEVNEFVWDNLNTHMIDCWSDVTFFHDAGTFDGDENFKIKNHMLIC